ALGLGLGLGNAPRRELLHAATPPRIKKVVAGQWRHGAGAVAWVRLSSTSAKKKKKKAEPDELESLKVTKGSKLLTSKRKQPKHNFTLGKIAVAIVGRPNVGKSTLFNLLVRKREAIVSNVPGTTRDRKEGEGWLGELEYTVCDTGGFEDLSTGRRSPTELLAPVHGTALVDSMQFQIMQGVQRSDVVLFVVDAKQGVTPDDLDLARWVRKNLPANHGIRDADGKLVHSGLVLVLNKTEGIGSAMLQYDENDLGGEWGDLMVECYRLAMGEPVPISAAHGHGLGDLHNTLLPFALERGKVEAKKRAEASPTELMDVDQDLEKGTHGQTLAAREAKTRTDRIHLSMIGRPNVGKSTLLNTIIGEERCIAGPMPGLTRDSVSIDWESHGRKFRLVDTAGIRRRTNLYGGKGSTMSELPSSRVRPNEIEDSVRGLTAARKTDVALEGESIKGSLRALDRSQVVVVVVDVMAQNEDPDASGCLTKHDLAIIGRVVSEGRGLVVAANKCDLAGTEWDRMYRKEVIEWVRKHIELVVPGARGVPVVPISGLTGEGVKEIIPTVAEVYDRWRSRIATPVLNRWVRDAQLRQRPPAMAGAKRTKTKVLSGPLKIKFTRTCSQLRTSGS
ncbi:GTPase Der (GTP-binding protein EngA), partial [Durusdinium trenchii]